MATQIDHIVIAVNDLAEASANYAAAGFTVTPGGEHVGGATHNALVSFQDGSYFELIAFTDGGAGNTEPHRWWGKLQRGEGLVDFAILSSNLETESAEIRERGLAVAGPSDGGRLRPDGQQVSWRTLHSPKDQPSLPFLIDDRTERSLRVPTGDAAHHPAGFTGVAGLTIGVADLQSASTAFTALLGTEGVEVESNLPGALGAKRFALGHHWIELVQPDHEPSALRELVIRQGDGPVAITLAGPTELVLSPDLTHAVQIQVLA